MSWQIVNKSRYTFQSRTELTGAKTVITPDYRLTYDLVMAE